MPITKLVRGKLSGTGLSEAHVPQALDKLDEIIDAVNGATTADTSIVSKANKVSGGTTGNLVSLTATGDIADSGKKAADFPLKVSTPTNGHILTTDATGQPVDSGHSLSEYALNAVTAGHLTATTVPAAIAELAAAVYALQHP